MTERRLESRYSKNKKGLKTLESDIHALFCVTSLMQIVVTPDDELSHQNLKEIKELTELLEVMIEFRKSLQEDIKEINKRKNMCLIL